MDGLRVCPSFTIQPFIIYIHLSSDDPWFRGPWFVRVKEVQHVPTKMFYEREVFMSNIQDTNPMRSIIRKCAVLFPTDYVKCKRVTLAIVTNVTILTNVIVVAIVTIVFVVTIVTNLMSLL